MRILSIVLATACTTAPSVAPSRSAPATPIASTPAPADSTTEAPRDATPPDDDAIVIRTTPAGSDHYDPLDRPHIAAAPATATDRGVLARHIKDVLFPSIVRCIERYDPELDRRLLLAFVIGPDGKATNKTRPSGNGDGFDDCVTRIIEYGVFPPPLPGASVSVSYPLNF